MESEEFDKWCKEMDAAVNSHNASPPKQIFATLAAVEEAGESSNETPPDAGIPQPEQPPAPPRQNLCPVNEFVAHNLDFQAEEETVAEAMLRLGGKEAEKIIYGELLTNPITPEDTADPVALE
jgi:hypothetical protein